MVQIKTISEAILKFKRGIQTVNVKPKHDFGDPGKDFTEFADFRADVGNKDSLSIFAPGANLTRDTLKSLLKISLSEENYDFLAALHNISAQKRLSVPQVREQQLAVIKQFIGDKAETQMNISSDLTENIVKLVANQKINRTNSHYSLSSALDAAAKEVYVMITQNIQKDQKYLTATSLIEQKAIEFNKKLDAIIEHKIPNRDEKKSRLGGLIQSTPQDVSLITKSQNVAREAQLELYAVLNRQCPQPTGKFDPKGYKEEVKAFCVEVQQEIREIMQKTTVNLEKIQKQLNNKNIGHEASVKISDAISSTAGLVATTYDPASKTASTKKDSISTSNKLESESSNSHSPPRRSR